MNQHTVQGYVYSALCQLKLLSDYKIDICNIKKQICICASLLSYSFAAAIKIHISVCTIIISSICGRKGNVRC